MNHMANTCTIDDVLAVSSVLCPELVQVNNCIFISELYQGNIDGLERQFKNNRRKIEQFVNSWSLGDFFIGSHTDSVDNEKILKQFGDVLVYFWSRRVKEVFPEKNVIVELGMNIMGESGLTITMYQKEEV